jgi:hypothetical protein
LGRAWAVSGAGNRFGTGGTRRCTEPCLDPRDRAPALPAAPRHGVRLSRRIVLLRSDDEQRRPARPMGPAAHHPRAECGRSVRRARPRRGGGPRDPLCALPRPQRHHCDPLSVLRRVLPLLRVPRRNDGPRGAAMARRSVSYTSGRVRDVSGSPHHSAVPGRRAHLPVPAGRRSTPAAPGTTTATSRPAEDPLRQLR